MAVENTYGCIALDYLREKTNPEDKHISIFPRILTNLIDKPHENDRGLCVEHACSFYHRCLNWGKFVSDSSNNHLRFKPDQAETLVGDINNK